MAFISQERHSKESQKKEKFKRTKFETNFSISKERYSIKRPCPVLVPFLTQESDC
jgi:hypothetical protein